ncbi:glyoxylate/hydroxypyruvate reductase HPR3-like [Rhodamnia argentea]|uniref:Glyoxylate/hydroxypyruvate reductase HPR3-like n=1 Tax=Rhodamnia argentea TaxID=178133 RepID=A0ABM3H5M5_9MYRT|nr:glyoxylate/hydroxypyruvate reductase HPR3-like [Rhodamnia argentea]XP_048131915.1 glyoxylate/hydroxypyruvate reductase HPR3-like [Rhodamnia argentea]
MASHAQNDGAPSPLHRRSPPRVLLLRKPHHFSLINRPLPDNFHFLKPWESPLPFDDFLSSPDARAAEAILTYGGAPVTADMLRRLPEARLVVTASAGLNHIDLAECRRRGIAIACSGDAYTDAVADLAVGLLIDVLRKLSAGDRYLRRGLWSSEGEFALGSKLGGKRVGIVGLGRIGLEVAKRLEAFGCAISYQSRKKKPYVSYAFYSNVYELATNCDALVICCGLTEETHHMINREVLLALGKEGVIVNVARGSIIDEKEMVQLLVQGELGGAGLDVFENEPSVPEELLALDNVVLSPHTAVYTPETLSDLCDLVVGNLEAFFSNKPLLSPVLYERTGCSAGIGSVTTTKPDSVGFT